MTVVCGGVGVVGVELDYEIGTAVGGRWWSVGFPEVVVGRKSRSIWVHSLLA